MQRTDDDIPIETSIAVRALMEMVASDPDAFGSPQEMADVRVLAGTKTAGRGEMTIDYISVVSDHEAD